MKAMILAAGRGTRMGELTKEVPKPLIEVGGRPMISYVFDALKRLGIDDFVINTHYKHELLEEYLSSIDDNDISIVISRESDLLETGGGILFAKKFLVQSDTFIVHNADVYSEIDLQSVIDSHVKSQADATLLVKDRETTRHLLFSDDMHLCGWQNLKTGERVLLQSKKDLALKLNPLGFSGIHILNSSIFSLLESMGSSRFSIIDAYIKGANSGYKIQGYDIGKTAWFDIGTPEKLQEVERHLSAIKCS